MSFFTGFKILSSGMSAQRVRMNLVSSNLANADTTRTEEGGPYQRRDPVFRAVSALPAGDESPWAKALRGVAVTEVRTDPTPGPLVYDPEHPDADQYGNVEMPNVNVVEEMVNLVTASRSFEASAQAFQVLRDMIKRSIDMGR